MSIIIPNITEESKMLHQVTGHKMPRTDFFRFRYALPADLHTLVTPSGKAAAWSWIDGARDLALDRNAAA